MEQDFQNTPQETGASKITYCTSCGQALAPGDSFRGNCGASQAAHTAPTPIMEAPAAAISADVPQHTYKFPVISVILIALTTVYAFIDTFILKNYYTYYSFSDILFNVLFFVPYVLMTIGLLTCRTEDNFLFSFGFIFHAGVYYIAFLQYMAFYLEYGFGYSSAGKYIVYYLLSIILPLLVGICYFSAKPSMRIFKLVVAAVSILFGFISIFVYYTTFLRFLFYTVLPMTAVIFYTPFKKQGS